MADLEHLPVARAREGDPRSWDVIFRRYQLPLFVYARELLNSEQAALDVVQETFLKAVRHIGSLRSDGKFGSWLFGIAHQQCLQRWRRKELPSVALEDEPELVAETIGPDEWLIKKEREAQFYAALELLPPEHKSVLVLHFLEDFSLEEIAGITGVPSGTVKSRLHYAKRTLRTLMEDNE